nr:homocysteine S-methyltransferase family protein [Ardenticatena sp.]
MKPAPLILLDGAMGTMLQQAGLPSHTPAALWTCTHPLAVWRLHRAYVRAGARILLTNTLTAQRPYLAPYGLAHAVEALNQRAVWLARRAAQDAPFEVRVAGSVGPPLDDEPAAHEAFVEQTRALVAAGVDMLWFETQIALAPLLHLVERVRVFATCPLVATFTFHAHGMTPAGETARDVAHALSAHGFWAFGANCGTGPAEMERVIAEMAAAVPDALLVAKSNAGFPPALATPAEMAAHARRVAARGARLIGGCCGTTPAHIAAMANALGMPNNMTNIN